jgi:hypothetical protein
MEFITEFLADRIVFKNKKRNEVAMQIMKGTRADSTSDVNRLLALSISTLTEEEIVKLQKQIDETNKTLEFWNTTTPTEQFITDLEGINN